MSCPNVINRDSLVGESTVVDVSIVELGGSPVKTLLDSGSQVSTINRSLFEKVSDKVILHDVDSLEIMVGNGNSLPYLGVVMLDLVMPVSTVGNTLTSLFLVVEDSAVNAEVPMLLGTNVLRHCYELCKKQGNDWQQQIPIGWHCTFLCLEMSECLPPTDTVVKCQSAIEVPPRGMVDFHVWSIKPQKGENWLVSDDDLALPGGVVVTPVLVSGDQTDPITVTINNMSDKCVLIPPGTKVCHAEAVQMMTQVSDESCDPHKQFFELFDFSQTHKNCDDTQFQKVKELLSEHKNTFSLHDFDIGKAKGIYHEINLTDHKPFKDRYRRIPPSMLQEVRNHISMMLDTGVIKPSQSPYASPVVLVRKKSGALRFCVDFRRLNSISLKDCYGLPRADDLFDRLSGACWFSTLDLKSGYWQIEMDPRHKHLTAFTVGPLGFFEFERMPFGLSNAGSSFQRMIERCMGNDYLEMCLLYLDDIFVYSKSFEEHLVHVRSILQRLHDFGLKVNPSKCSFFCKEAKFLGHVVSAEGLHVDPEKVSAVVNWEVPGNQQELRRFLGFAGYYRRFIKDFSSISAPLHTLLRGEHAKKKGKKCIDVAKYCWTDLHQKSFENLKAAITSAPVLAFAEFGKPFELHVDASLNGLGAVLYQSDQQGALRPVAFGSRGLRPPEVNYPAHKLEFCALKWAVTEKFKDYLYHSSFRVVTDNNPLTYVLTTAKLDATGHRWVAELADYDFDIVYRPGSKNADADGLSRCHERPEAVQATTVSALLQGSTCTDVACLLSNSVPDNLGTVTAIMTKEEWKTAQSEDEVIRLVMDHIEGKKVPNKHLSQDSKILLKTRGLFLDDGLLWRKKPSEKGDVKQLVLPERYRHTAFQKLHDEMGHLGRDRTYDLFCKRFFFPRMLHHISTWIKNCEVCFRRKSSTNQVAPLVNIHSSQPMQILCIDYLSLERSVGGFENVLVITDHYTRYAKAIPTRNQTATTTAKHLFDLMINDYGLPEKIHSDQGPAFESRLIKELCKMLGVQKTHTTPYHAMGNGQVERFNQSLINLLSTLPEEKKSRWRDYIGPMVHAYNCTVNDATGFSPFYLMFGRQPRLPIDVEFGLESEEVQKSYTDYVKKMQERLEHAYKLADDHISKHQAQGKRFYDKKARAATVRVGDRVLVRKVRFDGTHKLCDKWEKDVHLVINQPDVNIPVFEVQPENGVGKVRKLHRNLLHPFVLGQTGDADVQVDVQSDPESDDESDYEILPPCIKSNAREPVDIGRQGEDERQEVAEASQDVDQGSQPRPQAGGVDHEVAERGDDSSGILPDIDKSNQIVDPVENVASSPEPPTVRRSGRDRKPPAWQTSGDFVMNFQQNQGGKGPDPAAGPNLSLTNNQQLLLIKMLLSHVMPD